MAPRGSSSVISLVDTITAFESTNFLEDLDTLIFLKKSLLSQIGQWIDAIKTFTHFKMQEIRVARSHTRQLLATRNCVALFHFQTIDIGINR